MNMSALIPKFQKRLEIPRVNAVRRVVLFLFLSACFAATVALSVILFPYTDGFTEKISLLPGNHIRVQEILNGEVLVSRSQFLQMEKENVTFIALGKSAIVYMTKVRGISYRYNEDIHTRFGYFVSSQSIQNEFAIREIERDNKYIILNHIVLPLLILVFLYIFIGATQTRRVSGVDRDVFFPFL